MAMKNSKSLLSLFVCLLGVGLSANAQAYYEQVTYYCPFRPSATTTTTNYTLVGGGHTDVYQVQGGAYAQAGYSRATVESLFVRASGYRRCPVGSIYQVDSYQVLESSRTTAKASTPYGTAGARVDGYSAYASGQDSSAVASNGYVNMRIFYSCYRAETVTRNNTPQENSFQLCNQATQCLSYMATQDPYDLHEDSYSVVLLQRMAAIVSLRNCAVR
jgi:hypothetical protein